MAAQPLRIGPSRRPKLKAPAVLEVSPWTGKAPRLNQHGRDIDSPAELERARTVWLRDDPQAFTGKGDFSGFTTLPHAWFADLKRITSGATQLLLLFYGWSQSYGRERKPGDPPPEWSIELEIPALADLAKCTERQIEADLVDLHARKVIEMKRVGPKRVRYRLRWAGWESLPDYQAVQKKPAASDDEMHDDGSPDEPGVSKDSRPVVLLKKPAYVRAGQSSRPVPVTTGVKQFRLVNESTSHLGLEAVVIAGELLLTARFENASPIVINSLVSKSRSILRGEADGGSNGAEKWPSPAPTGSQKARSNDFNNLASKSRSILREIDPEALRNGLLRFGYRIERGYAAKLADTASSIGCTLEFCLSAVDERAAAGRRSGKPLTDRILKPFFSESLPELWGAHCQREQALEGATADLEQRYAESQSRLDAEAAAREQAETAWLELPGTQQARYLSQARTRLKDAMKDRWALLTKQQQAANAESAAMRLFAEDLAK